MKKKCICCGIEKDISEYYSHPRTADGHLNKCKECCKKQNKDNREKHLEYYREYDRNRKAKANDTSGGMNMFEKEAEDSFKSKKVLYKWETDKHSYIDGFKDGAKFGYDKLNEELKEKISVLLSCKNCPENKGGWICAKEYENKCLAQKIVFIQELKKENAKLKKELKISQRCWQDQKNISFNANCSLHKAKELIEELSSSLSVVGECDDEECELLNRAEQFLKDSVE